MQVTCFGFNWEEVRKRPDVEAVLEEMIRTDDIDNYATYLPEDIWIGDSAMLHFAVTGALAELLETPERDLFPGVERVAQLLNGSEFTDELGLSGATEGAYFVSLSPERVTDLARVFSKIPTDALAQHCAKAADSPPEDIAPWLNQWRDALNFAESRGLGLIGHCG